MPIGPGALRRTRGRPPAAARAIAVGMLAVGAWASVSGTARPRSAFAEGVVAVRYRGTPAGVPVLNELAAIGAAGFAGVTWSDTAPGGIAELRRLAGIVGLAVVIRPEPVPLTIAAAKSPGAHVDVRASGRDPRELTPLVWRAIAHGARTISFDPGQSRGTGLTREDGSAEPWVPRAVAIARQLSANPRLVDVMRPGPAVTIEPAAPDALDVVLLDGGRAWIIVATNTSASSIERTVIFPRGVPYGLWASWLDDSGMSMLGLPSGARWSLALEPYATRVYFIDKSERYTGLISKPRPPLRLSPAPASRREWASRSSPDRRRRPPRTCRSARTARPRAARRRPSPPGSSARTR